MCLAWQRDSSVCPELLDGSFRDPLPPELFSYLLGQRAEEGGFRTQQKDGTAWEGQAPTEGSMDAVLLTLDAGSWGPWPSGCGGLKHSIRSSASMVFFVDGSLGRIAEIKTNPNDSFGKLPLNKHGLWKSSSLYTWLGGKQRLGEEFIVRAQTTEVRRAILDSHWRPVLALRPCGGK